MNIKIASACTLGIMYILSLSFPVQASDGFAEGFANSVENIPNHQNIKSADVPRQTLMTEKITPLATQDTKNTDSSAGQVTSVSQLSDVQPKDWAFSALQSLKQGRERDQILIEKM